VVTWTVRLLPQMANTDALFKSPRAANRGERLSISRETPSRKEKLRY
jgi:hypothetical protein